MIGMERINEWSSCNYFHNDPPDDSINEIHIDSYNDAFVHKIPKNQEMKRERETEIQQRNEMIAHLKDQLQEMKAKTSMENRYVKKMADVTVAQTQRRCQLTEKELKEEIEKLKTKIDEETRVNMEIESFLRWGVGLVCRERVRLSLPSCPFVFPFYS